MSLKLIFMLSFSLSATAANHLIVIGGGGEEPKKDETLFDNTFQNLGNYYQNSKWQSTTVSFNGGHKNLDKTIKESFKKPVVPFTNDSYNQIISEYIKQIKNGSIKAGDQLMVYLDTHGAVKGANELTHSVATSGEKIENLDTLGSSTVSLDKMLELTQLAYSKGIKMAVLDFSCHSGNALPLANDKTCVITSTSPNHYGYGGYGTFGYQFTSMMAKGKNLEELFLNARKSTTDKSYPMISTPQNGAITDFEYNNISPYLFYYEGQSGDKLSPYIMDAASKDLMCKREEGFSKLMALINQIEKINTVRKKVAFVTKEIKEIDLSDLKQDLILYKRTQDYLIKTLKSFNVAKLNEEIEITSSPDRSQLRIIDKQKIKDILATDYDAQIKRTQERMKAKNDTDPSSTDAMLVKYYQDAKLKKEKILKENPKWAQIPTLIKNYDANVQKTEELAARIAKGEKVLYDALYRGQSNIYQGKTNPCKDFVL